MRAIFLPLIAAMALLSGCANSSFNKAVDTNTQRQESYLDGYLEQAANDLTAINDCWTNVKKANADSMGCMMMSMALRMTNTFLYAFLGKPDMTRVPAAPEEIVESILTKSMKFAITKYGFDAVRKVVESGQVAQAQIASEGIAAASKPPLVVDKPVVVTVPAGSSVLPTTPAPTAPVATPTE